MNIQSSLADNMVKCHYCSEQTSWKQCSLGCCETVWVARLHAWWADKGKIYCSQCVADCGYKPHMEARERCAPEFVCRSRTDAVRHAQARPSPDDSAHDRYAAWKTACNVDRKLPGNNASNVIVRGSPATTAGRRQAAVHVNDAMSRIRKAFSFCRVVPWRWHILKLSSN